MDARARIREDLRGFEVADDRTASIMRRLSAAQKVAKVDELIAFGRGLMAAGVRAENPGWSEEQVRREVARRVLLADR